VLARPLVLSLSLCLMTQSSNRLPMQFRVNRKIWLRAAEASVLVRD
jgi:hypothetical protein